MKLELDSKAADIAEIKDNLALLRNFILGATPNQEETSKQAEDTTEAKDASPPHPSSIETDVSKGLGHHTSIGTDPAKALLAPGACVLSLPETSEENPHSFEELSEPNNLSDSENIAERAARDPQSFDNTHSLRRLPNPASEDNEPTRPRSAGVSTSSSHWQAQTAGDYRQMAVGQQPTTNVSINGVAKAIPSSIAGTSSFLPYPPQPRGPAAPYMMYGHPFGAPAPPSFVGWQGGPQPQPPYLQARAIGQWSDGRSLGAFGSPVVSSAFVTSVQRYNTRAGPHAFPKARAKSCSRCGDPAHFYKHCPHKHANSKGGKQFGTCGGKRCGGPFGPNKGGLHSLDRLDKAPPFPIDRQMELIDYMVATNRADDLRKAALAGRQQGAPAA
ncbi:hypothetical protein TWF718_000673 [Orbilia javanica]|uniref:CCHC-type domain-containing protein n=1 Tax=Orbilia javanica TaxID=47235 RepID=A0AAN8N7Q1_9PEZI